MVPAVQCRYSRDATPHAVAAAQGGGAPNGASSAGYTDYLEAISDPNHPEHESMRLWGPERFDPNVVDRGVDAAVNDAS
jgi:hypothetical protein